MRKKAFDYLLKRIKKGNVNEIRATIKNYETPDSLLYRGMKKAFVPDMVAYYPEKRDFFSIENELTKKSISDNIAKWILFGLEARKHSGNFFIVVPEAKEDRFRELVDSKQISAEIISI